MNSRAGGSGGGSGSDSTWSQEWRAQISREVESSAEKHEKTAIIQERILGMLNQHDSRISALEKRPEGFRADLGTYGGCINQLLYFGMAAFNTLLSVGAVLFAVFHK